MRIPYSTLKGFKAKANHLRDLLGIDSVSASLEALARISGYTSYHEVRMTPRLHEGTATEPVDVLPQLLSIRPGLTREGGLNVLAQLALFPKSPANREKPVLAGFQLGQFASPTPSAVSRFFRKAPSLVDGFNTADFAGHFRLTVAEAQSVLNEYAKAGFVGATGFDTEGIEAWRVLRDGHFAFGIDQDLARLSKKSVRAAEAALVAIAPKLAQVGVVEISLGGRPAFGLPGGGLVVGLEVMHKPYSRVSDGRAIVDTQKTLALALDGDYCSILVFNSDMIPARLARRKRLTGPTAPREVVAREEYIDSEEKRHEERYRAFNWAPVFDKKSIVLGSYSIQGGLDFNISEYLRREEEHLAVPLRGTTSDVRYPLDSRRVLQELMPSLTQELDRHRRLRSFKYHREEYSSQVLARADYYLAHGRLEAEIDSIVPRHIRTDPTAEKLCRDIQAAVLAQWALWAARRAKAQPSAVPKKAAVSSYFAVFDVLNFDQPQVIGYVRQTEKGHNAFRYLEDFWTKTLKRIGGFGQKLAVLRFRAGYLCTASRPATEQEIASFEAVCKEQGCRFLAIHVFGGLRVGFRSQQAYREHYLEEVPGVLLAARHETQSFPRLLVPGTNDASMQRLFDLIAAQDSQIRTRAEAHLVNTENVWMSDFARDAASDPIRSPVVLASGLGAAWKFTHTDAAWSAEINGQDWRVRLAADNQVLDITAMLGQLTHTQRLHPTVESGPLAYAGKLSSLLGFMGQLQRLKDAGLEQVWLRAKESEHFEDTSEGRLEWFVDILDNALNE